MSIQLIEKYKNDLLKSKEKSLLIELSKKDLDLLCVNEICGMDVSIAVAKDLYDFTLKDINKTNIILIDSDNLDNYQSIYLLEELLRLLVGEIHSIQNIKIVKDSLCSLVSFSSVGILGDLTNTIIDEAINFISDEVINNAKDFFIDKTLNKIDIEVIDKIRNGKLYLSDKAKKNIDELTKQLKDSLTPAESFQFVIHLLLNTAIDMPKLLYIKNPHKLDKNSLAILSLLLSIFKDKSNYMGLSVVYSYDDDNFQPYMKTDEKYSLNKQLLDEQRLFTQRYAILERPTSNIPNIAVKSWMFVGREDELTSLNKSYIYSKENNNLATLKLISGEPGVGKTKLIKQHLNQIRNERYDKKQIQLSLLNQVGHNSVNTGLSSLTDSILNEAKRLDELEKLTKLKNDFFEFITDSITSILGIGTIVNMSKVASDGIFLDGRIDRIKLNTSGNLDNKSIDDKQEQFKKLTSAIKELEKLSDKNTPIILFIDDLQWIDEDSSEYILQYFSKYFNVHMVSTIRPSDATTSLKKAYEDKELHKIALLKKANIKLYDNDKNEIEITSEIDINKIKSDTIHLLGLNEGTLKSLISKVIKGSEKHQSILARSIIEKFEDANAKGTANTLFAIETINMLCDEKLYTSQNKQIEKLILTKTHIEFNTEIEDFQEALEETFKILDEKYKVAFEHINTKQKDRDFKQKFNLMAYAVLEERLNILKIYFAEHGNAAVNTLLLSSLLGTPFNSTIVKNILEAISTTDEELLQPLREYILDSKEKISLTETHYEIIEEVYEILSRYTMFEKSYEYRHSLLNMFLEKQLDYQLDSVLTKDTINAKDKLYELILIQIQKEEKKQTFYGLAEQDLSSQEYENMLYFKQTILNLLKNGTKQNYTKWIKKYLNNLIELATFYQHKKDITKSIKLLNKVKNILEDKDKTIDMLHIYMNCIHYLANCYNDINQPENAIEYDEKLLEIMKKLYMSNEKEYAEKYFIALNNLNDTYRNTQNNNKRLFNHLEQVLKTNQDIISDSHIAKYFYNFALYLMDNKNYKEALNNAKKSYRIIISIGKEKYIKQYIESVKILSIVYALLNYKEKAKDYINKNRKELIKLYSNNQELWVNEYLENLLSLATYNTNKIDLLEEGLKIINEKYEEQPLYWKEWKNTFELIRKTTKSQKYFIRFEDILVISKELAIQSNQTEIQKEHVELAFSLINLNEIGKLAFNFFPKISFKNSNSYNVNSLLNSATYKKMDASIDVLPSLYQLTILFKHKIIGSIDKF